MPYLGNFCYYITAGRCQHYVAPGTRSTLYFHEIGKYSHLWPSLTDGNDSLLSWLRRSPLHFICKCLFLRQSLFKVTNVTNPPPDDHASILVAISCNLLPNPLKTLQLFFQKFFNWRSFCEDIWGGRLKFDTHPNI